MEPKLLIDKIIGLILQDAEDRRTAAGYGGRYDDGGAGSLQTQVRFYQYGARGILPPEWAEYRKQAETQADPEYAEYIRLKKKFDIL